MNVNYKICTVANDVYLGFLYYFTKSLIERCNNLSELHILYTGNYIESLIAEPLYIHDKIKICKYTDGLVTKNLWDDSWAKNVNLKSDFLKSVATNSDCPVFLVDVDCLFLKEFIDIIDMNNDVVVTHRPKHFIPYVGSFVGIVNKNGIKFIDEWKKQMQKISKIPKETLALANTISIMEKSLKIQKINEHIINSTDFQNVDLNTRILHFKGGRIGDAQTLLNNRLNNLKSVL